MKTFKTFKELDLYFNSLLDQKINDVDYSIYYLLEDKEIIQITLYANGIEEFETIAILE
jgi:hypothetical protein